MLYPIEKSTINYSLRPGLSVGFKRLSGVVFFARMRAGAALRGGDMGVSSTANEPGGAMEQKRKEGPLMDFPIALRSALRGYERRAPRKLLEAHPRIVARLGELWGSGEELSAYLNDLMISDRPDRAGFAAEVLSEIFFLKQLSELGSAEGPQSVWEPEGLRPGVLEPEQLFEFGVLEEEEEGQAFNAAQTDLSQIALELGVEGLGPGGRLREPEAGEDGAAKSAGAPSNWDLARDSERVAAWLEARAGGRRGAPDRSKLGSILHKRAGASEAELVETLNLQRAAPKRELFGRMLARAGVCSLADVQRALATQQGMLLVDLDRIKLEAEAIKRMPAEAARARRAIPLAFRKGWLAVAVDNPAEFDGRDYLSFVTQCPVELMWASSEAIERRLQSLWGGGRGAGPSEEFRRPPEPAKPAEAARHAEGSSLARVLTDGGKQEEATVSELVSQMLCEARRRGASDIHVEASPREAVSLIRMRVDGDLALYGQFERSAHEAVVSRLKILADLDISERRRPQDGKFSAKVEGGEPVEARLSVIPAAGGWEVATIRLLSRAKPMPLAQLGICEGMSERLMELARAPHGLVLVCGPTGSGKTTTLHSLLSGINTPERKIWTVEDPVEIIQPGLCQAQAQPKIGFGFDAALKAFLRADPDVIMVGEIRDAATAKAALEASLTGHLVMSTLHTNSAAETAVRLLDLGADPFALGDALRGILAQRLVKKLCSCAVRRPASDQELDQIARQRLSSGGRGGGTRSERDELAGRWRERFGVDGEIELGEPAGCPLCKGSGSRGRIGVYELLASNGAISRAIAARARAEEIAALAEGEGMVPLSSAALELALSGQISLKEARAVGL